jgi:hypothetical protein
MLVLYKFSFYLHLSHCDLLNMVTFKPLFLRIVLLLFFKLPSITVLWKRSYHYLQEIDIYVSLFIIKKLCLNCNGKNIFHLTLAVVRPSCTVTPTPPSSRTSSSSHPICRRPHEMGNSGRVRLGWCGHGGDDDEVGEVEGSGVTTLLGVNKSMRG